MDGSITINTPALGSGLALTLASDGTFQGSATIPGNGAVTVAVGITWDPTNNTVVFAVGPQLGNPGILALQAQAQITVTPSGSGWLSTTAGCAATVVVAGGIVQGTASCADAIETALDLASGGMSAVFNPTNLWKNESHNSLPDDISGTAVPTFERSLDDFGREGLNAPVTATIVNYASSGSGSAPSVTVFGSDGATLNAFLESGLNGGNVSGIALVGGANSTIVGGAGPTVIVALGDHDNIASGSNSDVAVFGNNTTLTAGNSTTIALAGTADVATAGAGTTATESGTADTLNAGAWSNVSAGGTSDSATLGNNSQASAWGAWESFSLAAGGTIDLAGLHDSATAGANSTGVASGIADLLNAGSLPSVTLGGTGDIGSVGNGSEAWVWGTSETLAAGDNTQVLLAGNSDVASAGTGTTASESGTNDTLIAGAWSTDQIVGNWNTGTIGNNSQAWAWGAHDSVAGAVGDTIDLAGSADAAIAGISTSLTLAGSGDWATVGAGASATESGSYDSLTAGAWSSVSMGGYGDAATVGSNSSAWAWNAGETVNAGGSSVVDLAASGDTGNIEGGNTRVYANGDAVNFAPGVAGDSLYGSNNGITASWSALTEQGSNDQLFGVHDAVTATGTGDSTVGSGNLDYGTGFGATTANGLPVGDITDTSVNIDLFSSGYGFSGGDFFGFGFVRGQPGIAAPGTDVVSATAIAQGYTQVAVQAELAYSQAYQSEVGGLATSSSTLSLDPTGPVWAGNTVTYNFATGPTSGAVPISDAMDTVSQSVIQRALQAWSSAAGITFIQSASTSAADVTFGWGSFATPTSNMIGNTYVQQTNGLAQPGAIVRLEDPNENPFAIDANGNLAYLNTGDATLFQVALHEVGHALGLSDTSDPNSVMYYSLGMNNPTLGATDIAAIQQIYGTPAHPIMH